MRKYICLVLAVLLAVCCVGCIEGAPADSAPVSDSANKETIAQKLAREIDDAYAKDELLPEYGTTLGMVELADTYRQKWAQIADEYYNKIMNHTGSATVDGTKYTADKLHAYVAKLKTDREQADKKKLNEYIASQKAIYGEGSIMGPIVAGYQRDLQKEWALQVVGIYEQLPTK